MADYSEFPTTPTAWQEEHARGWETITPLTTDDDPPPRRKADLVALVPGILFALLAISAIVGWNPGAVLGGGLVWVVLVAAGVALLISELRKARLRR